MSPRVARAGGVDLSDEQLTVLAYAGGTESLAGVGRRRPLDELEVSVGLRSLVARGLLRPQGDAYAAWTPPARALLAPLAGPAARTCAWVRHPAAGQIAMVRAAGDEAATAVVRHAGERRWSLARLAVTEAAGTLRGALARNLREAPGEADRGLWEAGVVVEQADGIQRGEVLRWGATAAGDLERIEPGADGTPAAVPTTGDALRADFEGMLGLLLASLTTAP